MNANWVETTTLAALRAAELGVSDVVFRHAGWTYRTVGRFIAQGGVGAVHELERRADSDGRLERIAGKTFHAHHLYQLRTDEVSRRDHQLSQAALSRISAIQEPHVLPTILAAPIADNFLLVTPLMGPTLLEAVSRQQLTPRARARLLLGALHGLLSLHDARILHRDFTLRNILLDERSISSYLFDFDLALSFDDLKPTTYRGHYAGRVFGSPGYSVAPETLDPALLDAPLSTALDVYAVGGALHGLYSDQLPYGPMLDMWGLLVRIAEGVVIGGRSMVNYPPTVPEVVRPIIDRCLERDPTARYPNVAAILTDLAAVLPRLDDRGTERAAAAAAAAAATGDRRQQLAQVFVERRDSTVSRAEIDLAENAMWTWGYQVEKSLGRVKHRNIFMAVARPDLVAVGQFPDANTFPKLVTVIDLGTAVNARLLIENWQTRFFPTFKKVRQGLMTGLHNVIYDGATRSLLLLSEYVDDPRFGWQLDAADLHIDGALALAFLISLQVAALHEHGVAHNNIHAGSLLFKGLPETGSVQPAMIGLIDPSLAPQAMADDVRALGALMGSWLSQRRMAQLPRQARAGVEALHVRLGRFAAGEKATVVDLRNALMDGLGQVDGNFEVLRHARGDLQQYALLVLSHRLYHKLWRPS